MYLLGDTVVTSASDLKKASECEFAFLRALDAKLGRCDPVPDPEDAMLERSGRLGDRHEALQLESYLAQFGEGVALIDRPDVRDADAVAAATSCRTRSSPAVPRSRRCCSSRRTPSSSTASGCRGPTPQSCCSATAR